MTQATGGAGAPMYGFVGLGVMGQPMALNLARAGSSCGTGLSSVLTAIEARTDTATPSTAAD
ncbi:NAD(P)-binding domain-containing protein [Streptomyces sp. NPDC094038]|uniref:NAD(P)-binding domain-containing protein n=1 Tax=Streptomyces sp. NPDC094038 TaxID=3366055 RepID=UPI003821F20D